MNATQLLVDPASEAMQAYRRHYGSDPETARLLAEIAFQPQGFWLMADGAAVAGRAIQQAKSAGRIPLLVAYNMANAGPAGYAGWIAGIAAEISGATAFVVLEPDSLPLQGEQIAPVLARAVETLKANPNTTVLIDAGHSDWLPVDRAIHLLQMADVAKADGFSLNVSNFRATAECAAYGDAIAHQVGKFYAIDTSRNGNGPHGTDWCNPPGRAIGTRPAVDPDRANHPWLKAYLWIKRPGESDGNGGNCFGGPPAGQWWEEYALDLVRSAGGARMAAADLPPPPT